MNILVAVVSGFASGVFLRSFFYVNVYEILFLLLLALLCAAMRALTTRASYGLAALCLCCVVLGIARTALFDTPPTHASLQHLHRRVSFEGVVVRDPDVREKTQRVVISVTNETESFRVLAVAKRDTLIEVGDTVHAQGTLDTPEPFATEGGRIFRYDKYLAKDGIHRMLNFATLRVTTPAPGYSVPTILARIKHRFSDALSHVLPPTNAALASGLIIGGKTGLGKELQDAFTRAGLIQIVVLSGYNIMIVAEWVMTILSYAVRSRRAQSIAGAIALLVFVGIAGFSATALRATVMALIALYARASHRTYDAGRALFAAVLLMLAWNPLYLVFDPGFSLSVSATAGLIWLSPLIELKLVNIRPMMLREACATTLAAQLAVLPLLLYQTGMLSFVALPANIIAMPLVPFAMAASAIASLAGIMFYSWLPNIATILALPASFTTSALIALAKTMAALPWSAAIVPAFPFLFVVAAYAALIFIASSKRRSMTLQLRLEKKASI